ncbi:MAG: hypothetical protein K5622_02515 [Endomicrobiaceae bacterium]|nr:hypothetical protein [Endomicrobiaceae bacterium]
MKKNYIKKSLLIVFTFFVTTLFVGVCNAASPAPDAPVKVTSVADFTSIDPKVEHEKIDTVLAKGILNAKVYTYFGDAESANLILEYKLSSGQTGETVKENIVNKRDYFLGTPEGIITENTEYVDYRIKGVFNVSGEEFIVYLPEGASATEYVRADVVNKIEKNINGSAGGKIEVFCGDQSKGDKGTVSVVVPAGTYSGDGKVIVDFLADVNSSSDMSSGERENILSGVSVDVENISQLNRAILINNLPLQTKAQADKFIMQYQEGTEWKPASNTNLSVDKTNQIFSFSAAKLGLYRVVEHLVLSKSMYRPQNRIVVKTKVINGTYPGFEFKYLTDGDKVKIYNLKGKKIAELTSGTGDKFIWQGRKGTNNSGDWAESGTYLYQIKLKDSSEVISGTIAFVW